MKKLLIASILTLCLTVGILPTAAAGEGATDSTDAIAFLQAVGIYTAADAEKPEETLTRANAAGVFAACMNLTPAAPGEATFSDVPVDHAMAGAVYAVKQVGLMNGYGDGSFLPDKEVTGNEAIKTIVSLLGYALPAEAMGGYPSGYLAEAASIGLLKNGTPDGGAPITRGMLALLLRNALDANLMIPAAYGAGGDATYQTPEGVTLLTEYFKIYLYKGQITGNHMTTLIADLHLGDDEVAIGTTVFNQGKTNAATMLGYNVRAYAKDADNAKTIIYIENSTTVCQTISGKDILSATTAERLCYTDGDREQSAAVAGATLVLNGQVKAVWTAADIMPENGEVTLIAPSGSGYTLLLVSSFKTLVVSRVNLETGKIYTKDETGEWAILTLDPTQNDIKYTLTDPKGTKINLPRIGEWDILSVAKSENGKVIRAILCSNNVEGKVTEVNEEQVTIDGTAYDIAPDLNAVYNTYLELGTAGIFYLDYQNQIGAVSKTQGSAKYGWLVSAAAKTGLNKIVQFKIFTQESEMITPDAAEKINFNDTTIAAEDVLLNPLIQTGGIITSQLVIYELDAAGKLSSLKTAKTVDASMSDRERYDTFTKDYETADGESLYCQGPLELMLLGKWIGVDTIVFNVPDTNSDNDKDYLVANNFAHSSSLSNIALYDVDARNRITVAVIKGQTGASDVKSIEGAGIGVVQGIATAVNEEGETVKKLYVHNKLGDLEGLETNDADFPVKCSCIIYGAERTIMATTDPLYGQEDVAMTDLQFGDVVAYELNQQSGKLTALRIVFRAHYPVKLETFFTRGASIAVTTNYTRLNAAFADVIGVVDDGVRVSAPLTAGSSEENERFYLFGAAARYEVDLEKETIKEIQAEDIMAGDRIFTARQNMTQAINVIYK